MRLPSLTAAATGLILFAAAAQAQTDTTQTDQTQTDQTQTDTAQTDTAQTEQQSDDQAGEPARGYDLATPLAEVDGTPVTLGEVIAILRELPQQYQQLPDEVLYDGLVEQLVDQLVLSRAAREAGFNERPAVALKLLNQERAILADAYLREQVEKRASREAIERLYEERYVNAEPVEEVKAAHILVESEELAQELREKLDAGADFAELAREHGTDGTAQRGGDLGWFSHDQMVPAFADAVFAMEPGTIAGPVETDFGWHLIKLEDRRTRPVPPLAQVQAELMQEVMRAAQVAVVEELRAEAEIDVPAEAPVPPEAIRADDMLTTGE